MKMIIKYKNKFIYFYSLTQQNEEPDNDMDKNIRLYIFCGYDNDDKIVKHCRKLDNARIEWEDEDILQYLDYYIPLSDFMIDELTVLTEFVYIMIQLKPEFRADNTLSFLTNTDVALNLYKCLSFSFRHNIQFLSWFLYNDCFVLDLESMYFESDTRKEYFTLSLLNIYIYKQFPTQFFYLNTYESLWVFNNLNTNKKLVYGIIPTNKTECFKNCFGSSNITFDELYKKIRVRLVNNYLSLHVEHFMSSIQELLCLDFDRINFIFRNKYGKDITFPYCHNSMILKVVSYTEELYDLIFERENLIGVNNYDIDNIKKELSKLVLIGKKGYLNLYLSCSTLNIIDFNVGKEYY